MYLPLETTWGIAKTLYFGNQSVMPTKCYIGIHERAIKAASSKFGNTPLYKVCKEALENKDMKLTQSQRQLLTKYVLEGTLNGLNLESKKFDQYMADLDFIGMKSKEYKHKYEVHIILKLFLLFIIIIENGKIMKNKIIINNSSGLY